MTRLQDILTSPHQPIYEEIIPAPDFEISHEVMIECPTERPDIDVLNWITKQLGGHWIMDIWTETIKDAVKVLSNPHLNNRGLWAYLVRKA